MRCGERLQVHRQLSRGAGGCCGRLSSSEAARFQVTSVCCTYDIGSFGLASLGGR